MHKKNSKQKARTCEKQDRKNTVCKAMPRYGKAPSGFLPGHRGTESISSPGGPGGLHRKDGAAEGHQEESKVQEGPKAITQLCLFVSHYGSDRQVHVVQLKAVSRASVRKCYFTPCNSKLYCCAEGKMRSQYPKRHRIQHE